MFDLEESIKKWRRQMLVAGIKAPVLLEELEGHLREDVEEQIVSGVIPCEAFEIAARRIGSSTALNAEFKKAEPLREVFRRKSAWVLMATAFLGCWIEFGESPALGIAYGVLLVGLIVATFVDFAYFIIPDRLTFSGIFAGLLCSLLLPQLHGQKLLISSLSQSLLGISAGAGLVYAVLRVGKLAFGKQRLRLADNARVIFADSTLFLPDKAVSYDELFYRESDAVRLHARTVEFAGHSFHDVSVCLTRNSLRIGNNEFNPKDVTRFETTSAEIILPREVMGIGDVKLMAAIGAFLGWQAAIFTLIASSLIGSLTALGLIAAHRRRWSERIPYGPYLALSAVIWIFAGKQLLAFFAP